MKVITYTKGKLTVINGNDFYSEDVSKPNFISGTDFYYEPTLKLMDGQKLSEGLEAQALEYINSFSFPSPVQEVMQEVHCVDTDGNYLGLIVNTENHVEVPLAPPKALAYPYWNGTAFVESCLIDKDSGKYKGIGDTRTAFNAKYAPVLLDTPFCVNAYVYSDAQWTISLEDARKSRQKDILEKQREAVTELLPDPAFLEVSSFTGQSDTASAWKLDNNVLTPFIDSLLISRDLSETKEELVDKIIYKASIYNEEYPKILGKYHNLSKKIEDASSLEDLELIVWS